MKKSDYCYADEKVVFGFDGTVGYEFLSNFYSDAPTAFEGIIYPNSENAYQAAKTFGLGRTPFYQADCSAAKAKKLGKEIKRIRQDWQVSRDWVMAMVVLDKFMRNPELGDKLIATDNRTLIEANHWNDTYWGVDFQLKEGKNKLGKTLMGVRTLLRYQRHPRTIYGNF